MYLGSFSFKNLDRSQNMAIIVILLISKVLLLIFFSSEILSITIDNPYSYIDSIEDLEKRNLEAVLYVPGATIENFQNDTKLKKTITRALANDRQNQLEYDFNELFQQDINPLFDNISVKQSHVLLASKADTEMIISLNENKYGSITHISRQLYYDMIYGYLFRKDMNRFVVQIFHRV